MNKAFIRYVLCVSLGLESIFLILTSSVALMYKEPFFWQYFLTGLALGLVGFIGFRHKPKSNTFFAREGFVVVALTWLVLSLAGAIPIFLTGEIPNYIDAVFEIVSGFTTTGATIVDNVEGLSHISLFWRAFTHWIGGMGILVFALAILPSAGGSAIYIMRAESPGPSVGKLVSKLSQTAKILYEIYIGLTFIQIVCLLLCKMSLFDSVTLSLATAGTGGFGILNDSFVRYSSSVQIVTTIFMILFGVNFNVYYFLLAKDFKSALKCEEMRWYFIIIIVSSLLIALNTLSIFGNVFTALKHAFFQVASVITTTGYASYDFDTWPQFSKTILLSLMFIGACAGSTGGGIKVSRIVILLKDMKNSLRKYVSPREVKMVRFENKAVDRELVNSIRSYIGFFFVIFFVSLILLSLNNLDFMTNFSALASCINNIGPAFSLAGPMRNYNCFNWFSKIVLIFDMLAGRLELIPMLVLVMSYFRKKRKIGKIEDE